MVYILWLSSLRHAIETWKRGRRQHLFDSDIIAIPGLHLNHQSPAQTRLKNPKTSPTRRWFHFVARRQKFFHREGSISSTSPYVDSTTGKKKSKILSMSGIVYCQWSGIKKSTATWQKPTSQSSTFWKTCFQWGSRKTKSYSPNTRNSIKTTASKSSPWHSWGNLMMISVSSETRDSSP